MKKLIPLILCLALLLSGCGLAEQARTVKEEYLDPSIEAARGGGALSADASESGPNVLTDRSALTDYVPAETVFSHPDSGTITELAPSDSYGRLLPFAGAYIYDNDGNVSGESYGLVTESGRVVLDAVLPELRLASYQDAVNHNQTRYLNIYIMGKPDSGGTMTYALCGADGSWATDFDYTTVTPMQLGVLCLVDEARNSALCIGEDGSTVFDTSHMEAMSRLKSGSVADLADCSGGFMTVTYTNDQRGYMDKDGNLLNRYVELPSYFDAVTPFSYGLAAVQLGGRWGYLRTDGSFLLQLEYDSATPFADGLAVVSKGGVFSVIGVDGIVKKELTGAASVELIKGRVAVTMSDGTVQNLRADTLEPMTMYEYDGVPFSDGYWVRGENGVRAQVYGVGEVYFSGGAELLACASGLYLVKLADDTCAVMDKDSRVVAAGNELSFVADCVTDEIYILSAGEDGMRIYSSSGALVASGVQSAPMNGFVMCSEGSTTGWKNSSGEWVFRIRMDEGD